MGVKITYPITVAEAVEERVEGIRKQVEARSYEVANEMRNSALTILRGQRNGRVYKVPGKESYYTASAPGEPPAVRTGDFRRSWQPTARALFGSYFSRIETDIPYAGWLEDGTPGGQMAPRPHHQKILEHAEPKAVRIYSAPYD